MLVAVAQRHDTEAGAGELGQRRPSLDLVVVELGELRPERGALGVLVHLRLPALGGDRRATGGAVDDHDPPGEPLGQIASQGVAWTIAALPQQLVGGGGGLLEVGRLGWQETGSFQQPQHRPDQIAGGGARL